VQLDRVPLPRPVSQETGTPTPPGGVGSVACANDEVLSSATPRERVSALSWLLVLTLCFSVLGQGQRCEMDPRFGSPVSTLRTYWEALSAGDAETASECIEDGNYTGPYPGAVWFMPTTRDLRLEEVHSLPVRRGRVMVNYEVHYFALGIAEELSFRTENHLVQVRGEWRIAPPFGNVSQQQWRPLHRLTPI
jgi:hypothetical protein